MNFCAKRFLGSMICTTAFATALHAQPSPPLNLEDALVLAPAPQDVREIIVNRRCVAFTVDAAAASRLRAAGGDEAYVRMLRSACELEFRNAERINTAGAYANYISRNPNGRFLAEARRRHAARQEDEIFRAASEEQRGAVFQYFAFKRYLRDFPSGRYAAEANTQMERLLR
jgi:hypothetical protein